MTRIDKNHSRCFYSCPRALGSSPCFSHKYRLGQSIITQIKSISDWEVLNPGLKSSALPLTSLLLRIPGVEQKYINQKH